MIARLLSRFTAQASPTPPAAEKERLKAEHDDIERRLRLVATETAILRHPDCADGCSRRNDP